MATILNENRVFIKKDKQGNIISKNQYDRILLSKKSEDFLISRGYEVVFSSNVSAIATDKDALIIRFHNGSVYSYAKQARNYEKLMAAASKGKWVWRFLRRKGVPYKRIGSLPLEEDVIVRDEEIMKPRQYDISTIVPPDFMETGALPQISITSILTNTMLPTMSNGGNLATIALLASI